MSHARPRQLVWHGLTDEYRSGAIFATLYSIQYPQGEDWRRVMYPQVTDVGLLSETPALDDIYTISIDHKQNPRRPGERDSADDPHDSPPYRVCR